MRFWIRESAGWTLLSLSLYMFYRCYHFWVAGSYIEAAALTLIGIVVFRGGIHLLKIAIAARICLEAEGRINEQAQAAAQSSSWPPRRPAMPRR